MKKENLNPLINAQNQLKKACDLLQLDTSVYEILKEPMRIIEVTIPVKMDDGKCRVFKGYRSQHSIVLGPAKGGIRFHPQVTMDEIKALSIWMTIKCTVIGIPYGGAKGGIVVNPRELSDRELESLSRGYIRQIHRNIGEKIDVPAPDVNTNAKIMSWMMDEYMKLNKDNYALATFTGKPVEFGGSLGRDKATGLGVATITKKILEKMNIDIKGARIGLQGYGNVGSFTSKSLEDLGAKIIAVKDIDDKAIYNENGIKYDELIKYKTLNNKIMGFEGATREISEDEFWSSDYDVLIPAALENAINSDIAEKINAKVIVEAANGPTTINAAKVLAERKIDVVPDILANSGGVLVSYFEWVQNLEGYYWTLEEVENREKQKLEEAFEAVYDIKVNSDVTMREAAFMHAVKKIAKVMKLRGWY